MPGWPTTTSHAMLVRAADATHTYTGIDLGLLSEVAKPSVVVTADDLQRIGARVPEFYAGDLFCPVGKTPLYLGQPAALLIFETFDAFDRAQLELRGKPILKFGDETDGRDASTARIGSPGLPARRPKRLTSTRRSRRDGSNPVVSEALVRRSGRCC
jgi:hypothetical protein